MFSTPLVEFDTLGQAVKRSGSNGLSDNSLQIINSESYSRSNSRGGFQGSGERFGRDTRRTSLRIGGGSTPVTR